MTAWIEDFIFQAERCFQQFQLDGLLNFNAFGPEKKINGVEQIDFSLLRIISRQMIALPPFLCRMVSAFGDEILTDDIIELRDQHTMMLFVTSILQ